ncbi:hypothetical protein IZU98_18350 [Pseudomonas fulva]|uniref:Uncharacterized protein n=1 Tax=Pseudomonas fulva TaxID=47880 RepID=A0A7S9LFX5_9PSED|nr:hypothetical protein [Pseudomonas fulva]QPH48332.1 hypothetical protein IZU98_18350 [Pseudomonas fulva]
MKKPLFLLTVLFASMTANAAFKIAIPLEANNGGSLPASSIAFVKPGDTGSNPSNPTDPEIPTTPENPAENHNDSETPAEKTGAELCDDRVQPTINFLAMNYPDISYRSHAYQQLTVPEGEPILMGCRIVLNAPISKSFECISSDEYAMSASNKLFDRGFDGVAVEYYGTCQ